MQILRLVACGQEHGVRLTDIVNISGLNRPTARRILKTLLVEQAVEQDPLTRRYLIGNELTLLGLARRKRFPCYRRRRPAWGIWRKASAIRHS